MIWCETDEENGETADDINDETWEEFSQFSKENFRFLTFSEFDSFEKTAVFYLEQNVPEYKDKFERDFIPLNFLSSLFINTKKGKKRKFAAAKQCWWSCCLIWFMANWWKTMCLSGRTRKNKEIYDGER